MRTKFAILLAVAAFCITTAWASWTPEVLVTGGGSEGRALYDNRGHKLVFASDGVGHVTWAGGGGIGCNRYEPVSGWGTDCQISPTGYGHAIALDADGTTIHAVWEHDPVQYRRCTRNEYGEDVWGNIVQLARGGLNPVIASVPGDPNHVVVCWYEGGGVGGRKYEDIGFIECIGGVWGAPIRLDSTGAYMRRCPSIGVAPNGDVFVAYFANDNNTSGCQVYVKTRHNGVWGNTVNVAPSFISYRLNGHAIEVSPYTGNPHVVFSRRIETKISKKVSITTWTVCHTYRNSEGIWQTPALVSVPRQFPQVLSFSHYPTMAFDTDGSYYAAWREQYPTTSHGVMYSYCPAEGEVWSSPAWLTSDTCASYEDERPFVAVEEVAGAVHVVWGRYYPGNGDATEIWWRSSALGGGGGMGQPVALSQSGIELFPNPAKAGRVTVQYSLPKAGPVRATLLDVSGRAVRNQEVAATDRSGSFSLDVSGLNAGVYVARLVAGDLSVSKSLVVGR